MSVDLDLDADFDFDRVPDHEGTGSIKWEAAARVSGRRPVLPMWVADIDFPSPRPVVDALARRAELGLFGYHERGDGFYDAIRGWLGERHGWPVERAWIRPCPGVVPGVRAAIRALCRPGDAVVVQTPAYFPFFSAVTDPGCELVENPLRQRGGRYEIDFADLDRKLERARVLLFCNPHNPVGRVWTEEELAELGALCRARGTLVVSDDIHADLAFTRYTPLARARGDLAERVVTLGSPSKSFGLTSLHTAYCVASSRELADAVEREIGATGYHFGNVFGDLALETAYTRGRPWLDALVAHLRGNLRAIEAALGGRSWASPAAIDGTYLAWLDFRPSGLAEEEVTRRLEEAGVLLMDGRVFGAAGAGFRRMNFATSRALLSEALARITEAFELG